MNRTPARRTNPLAGEPKHPAKLCQGKYIVVVYTVEDGIKNSFKLLVTEEELPRCREAAKTKTYFAGTHSDFDFSYAYNVQWMEKIPWFNEDE